MCMQYFQMYLIYSLKHKHKARVVSINVMFRLLPMNPNLY